MWQAFARFRRGRPFWAGLFTMVGGLEILALPLSPIADLVLLGVAGISGAVIGIVLVVTGAFMWFSPPNRTLAGVLTLVFSLVSFVVSNLGGLIVGMVLGLVGGALALAWTPDGGDRAGRRRSRGRSDPAEEAPTTRFPRIDGPACVALVIGMVVVLHASGPGVAHAAPPPPPEPPPTDEPAPLLGLPPLLAPSSPVPSPVEPPLGADPPAGPLLPELLPDLAQQAPPGLLAPLQPAAVPDDGVVVSGLIGNLMLDTLTVTNFRYEGMVTYPVAGGGTQRALRIVLDTTDLGNVRIMIPGADGSVRVVQAEGSPNGSTTRLVLECTRIRLIAFGVLPLEFSLDFPPPPLIVIPFLSATDVDIDYVRLSTPTLVIPGLVATADGPAGLRGPGLSDAGLAANATVPDAPTARQAAVLVRLAALLDLPSMLRPYGLTQREADEAVGASGDPA